MFRDRGQWTVDSSASEFQDSLPRVPSAGSIEAGVFRQMGGASVSLPNDVFQSSR